MIKMFRNYSLLIATAGLLMACGESDAPQEKAVQVPAAIVEDMATETVVAREETAVQLPADAEVVVSAVMEKAEVVADVEAVTEDIVTAGDKPYQVVDGKISANAFEGWKTYNGGGCGTCHGKGGIGAVGPNLGNSVTQVLSKDEFMDVVANGRSGTMMRPHNTNKRVMDNLENLYAYLVARGDDVLGSGNLIKMPLGK